MGKFYIRHSYWIAIIFILACQPPINKEEQAAETLFTLIPPTASGVTFANNVVETEERNHLVSDQYITGAGVAIGDLNGDNLPEIYFAGNQEEDKLYLNKGNMKFEDITIKAGIEPSGTWSTGVTFADVDNDGDLDIYVCKNVQDNEQKSKNLLYINNGDLTFEEKSAEMGLADRGYSVQATFLDFDKDGFLDLYLINQPPSEGNRKGTVLQLTKQEVVKYAHKVYRNNQGTMFQDVTQQTGVNVLAFGLAATVGDFNGDSWPDIYVANDYERPDYLFMNQRNGRFVNTINQSMKHTSNFSMGTDVADYDNDGLLDIMVVDMVAEDHKRIKTNMGGMDPKAFWKVVEDGGHYQYMFNTLQKNTGNGAFSEVAHLAGVSNSDWSWAPLFADFDNDGWKDLFITNGAKRAMRNSDINNKYEVILDSLEEVALAQGKQLKDVLKLMDFVDMAPEEKLINYIYKNNGNLTFSKQIQNWGMDVPTLSYGSAYGDLDMDGDIDLVVNNMDDYASIYRNNSAGKQLGNYLRVKVINQSGSPDYSAKVSIYKDGQFWQMQELTNTRGYKSKSEDILHFGLSEEDQIQRLLVTFSNGTQIEKKDIKADQLITLKQVNGKLVDQQEPVSNQLFSEATQRVGINHQHLENEFDDYEKQVLLPHKMSNFGPGLATGDVNGDGLIDFYVGGAAGSMGALYLQTDQGKFGKSQQPGWETDKVYEDMSASLFDVDQDGDLDLYVVSGGNEYPINDERYADRLYLNDGQGKLSRSNSAVPKLYSSGSCVVPGDYDGDGDLDLFVGGRHKPGHYPSPVSSYILRNDDGKFTNVTEEIAPSLIDVGLVTSAQWVHTDDDQQMDLIVGGEWMPVMVLKQQDGRFENATEAAGLSKTTGWYFSLASGDFDGDGDQDLIAGNLGLNYKYKASEEEPFMIYSADFDDNGSQDIVLSYHEHGDVFPVRGRSCSIQQMPSLAEKFPTFEAFGEADLRSVYGADLENALHYEAHNFASVYLENDGKGHYTIKPLPNEAQFSSVNSVVPHDFDADGNLDILIAGNLFASEIETPRNDAGMGLYLRGDGKGNFEPVSYTKSGFYTPGDVKDMTMLSVGAGVNKGVFILVANNNNWLQAIEIKPNSGEQSADWTSQK
ncbi:MAG: VCBS repeat-containing protein [Bacteroidota bacterium]